MRRIFFVTVAAGIFLIAATSGRAFAWQDPVKSEVFQELTEAFARADSLNADILSPKHYVKAKELDAKAQNSFDKGQKLEKTRKLVDQALAKLELAIKAAELGQVAMKDLLVIRSEVMDSGLSFNKSKSFKGAEKKFREAALKVEKQEVKKAQKPSREAAKGYRKAVIQVLQKDVLSGARMKLKEARRTTPKQAYDEAEKSMKQLETYVKAQSREQFSVADLTTNVQTQVDALFSQAGIGG
jgi:hypothetical protein